MGTNEHIHSSGHLGLTSKDSRHSRSNLRQLEEFWEVVPVPARLLHTKEEQPCEDNLVRNTSHTEPGLQAVKLANGPKAAKLSHSSKTAKRRFRELEKKYVKSPRLRERFKESVRNHADLSHMRPAPPLDRRSQHHFIPYHTANINTSRVVFDASSKTTNSVPLDGILRTGEKLQPDLATTLMRFRTIKKMCRQVLSHPEHIDCQRIVWCDDPGEPFQQFQLSTQTKHTG